MRNLFSSNRIGVIQGRIAPRETKKYQSFPFKNWVNEFKHLKKLKIKKLNGYSVVIILREIYFSIMV